ncbi:uncharacterized protein LOC124912907 [Impatiens glandulifera]|uniref:uncharacterized protein LOC124912907 n=1 Tax=Impatiens glandulifera TaxID=253017 RepID=UPI001FB087E4|nr:uncharacterized protein LOC124912907 [Impatiens glandulifera]
MPHFWTAREICDFSSTADSLEILVHILEESSFSPLLRCGALNLLQKMMLSYALPTMSDTNMLEIPKLFIVLKNSVQSSIWEERVSAIGILIDLAQNITGKKDATFLASRIMLFVIDQINWLVRQVQDLHQQDGHSLLGLLLYLVENYPDLGSVELDKICLILEYLLDSCDQFEGNNGRFFASKVLLCLSKFIVCCLQKFDYFTVEILHKIKIVLKRILHCSLFDCHTKVLYYLYLQSYTTHHFMLNEMNDHLDSTIRDYLAQNTICNWSTYKVGKYAACQRLRIYS